MSTLEKFGQMFLAIGIFVALVAVVLFAVGRFGGRRGDKIVAGGFILPAVLMLLIGLVYPAINTLVQSFQGPNGGRLVRRGDLSPESCPGGPRRWLGNTPLRALPPPVAAPALGLACPVRGPGRP